MNKAIYTFLFLIIFSNFAFGQNSIGLIGGNIFDGQKFVKRDLYIVDEKITFTKPNNLTKTISIQNQFVIPPFGDAHTHNMDRDWQISFIPDQYLKEGTFYVQNLTAKTRNIEKFRKFFSTKETPDVIYANQGISSTLGHPFMAYEPYAMGLNDFSKWKDDIEKIKKSRLDENNSYIFIDNKKEAKEKLKFFFEGNPDVVKIFLLDVQDYEKNSTDDIPGNSGLSPELAKYVIKESHKRGLKVYSHINNVRDFELGVKLGVDGFAHIPLWNGKPDKRELSFVSDKLMKKAIKKGVKIMPTMGIYTGYVKENSAEYKAIMKSASEFMTRYKNFGGTVLIGSDMFNNTLTKELKKFIETDSFSKLELLKIVSETTPKTIFPKRRIGHLKEGFEGSVLVLEKNPLEDSNNLFKIKHRIKQGKYINVEKK